MTQALVDDEITPLILKFSPVIEMTDEQFFALCQLNRDYRIERTNQGEIVIMSPTGSETGNRNAKLTQKLGNWTDKDGNGIDFDSSTGFKLPTGATKSSDAAWIKLEKWNALTPEQKTKFAPVCPDFVVELRSPSDQLQALHDKLQEYINNGTSLGWLIDRKNRQVYIYRPGQEVECLDNPETISGDPVFTRIYFESSENLVVSNNRLLAKVNLYLGFIRVYPCSSAVNHSKQTLMQEV